MISTAKFAESYLALQFKDIGRYLEFFDKSIEAEKHKAAKAALKHEDEMFQHIARYHSHISFPAIHNNALLIFMHSSFERMFCWIACWFAIAVDGGSKIKSLTDYEKSKEYLKRFLASGKTFESPEWKSVEALRQVRNHLAHGGSENILGVEKNSHRLRAARKINRQFAGAFDITESDGKFTIEPNESTIHIAATCYSDFLFLLARSAKDADNTSAAPK